MTAPASEPARSLDEAVVAAAAAVHENIQADLLARAGRQAAVIAAAPAGAGKTEFISLTAGVLRSQGLRVAVVAPTNEQVHNLVLRIKQLHPDLPVALVRASGREPPAHVAALPGVTQPSAADARANRDPLVAATLDKLADAYVRTGLDGFDVLVIDEAFQADSARYYAAAHVAPTHLLVGDTGQLDPFSPIDDAAYWRGGPEDPLQTAAGVLLRNHPSTSTYRLPVTWRLDPRAIPIARSFYPGHEFAAAVREGVRQLRLTRPGPGSGSLAVVDRALDEAASHGWANVTLPGVPVLSADPATGQLIRDLIVRLLARNATARCERRPEASVLWPTDVAVGVSHNDQKNLVRVLLDQANLSDVTVETANRLQGLTFEVVIAWHPLAGATTADAFHFDPGRLCVLLTRHRQACIVVGRDSDRALLDGVPPATPGYLGWEPDSVLDGWGVHESVFRHLDHHVIAA